jgi:hypothetical protein
MLVRPKLFMWQTRCDTSMTQPTVSMNPWEPKRGRSGFSLMQELFRTKPLPPMPAGMLTREWEVHREIPNLKTSCSGFVDNVRPVFVS